jgi:hypothetical protein
MEAGQKRDKPGQKRDKTGKFLRAKIIPQTNIYRKTLSIFLKIIRKTTGKFPASLTELQNVVTIYYALGMGCQERPLKS